MENLQRNSKQWRKGKRKWEKHRGKNAYAALTLKDRLSLSRKIRSFKLVWTWTAFTRVIYSYGVDRELVETRNLYRACWSCEIYIQRHVSVCSIFIKKKKCNWSCTRGHLDKYLAQLSSCTVSAKLRFSFRCTRMVKNKRAQKENSRHGEKHSSAGGAAPADWASLWVALGAAPLPAPHRHEFPDKSL